jgi:hypothetical protein
MLDCEAAVAGHRERPDADGGGPVGAGAGGGKARPGTMDVGDAARSVLFMAGMPLDANVLFMTVMATKMPYVGRG